MPAAYHNADFLSRKTKVVRVQTTDVLDRIRNGPRPAKTIEYEFSGGIKKYRPNSEIYDWAE